MPAAGLVLDAVVAVVAERLGLVAVDELAEPDDALPLLLASPVLQVFETELLKVVEKSGGFDLIQLEKLLAALQFVVP